ncbi:NAD(P)H-dependent oxidoreductase [Hymenobacter sp.]|jgi:FMN reductase|uniref:NADPH-dependent FMN reductase n=1 Tax=Hymenobacter sp. TaxID=1898978 RepID=UPI002EDB165A
MASLVICCSLTKGSKTNVLAREVESAFAAGGRVATLLELSDYNLPQCDGRVCYEHPEVQAITQLVADADCIIFCCPVYVYDLSAAAKNVVELTGRGSAWFKKSVGFVCMAGTLASFMSVMPFANSLMFDYKCVIVPKFVYVTATAFEGAELTSPDIKQRITHLTADVQRLGAVSQTLSDW